MVSYTNHTVPVPHRGSLLVHLLSPLNQRKKKNKHRNVLMSKEWGSISVSLASQHPKHSCLFLMQTTQADSSLLIQPANSVHQSAHSASRISAPVCSFSQQDQCTSLLIQPESSVHQSAHSTSRISAPVCSFSQQVQCQSAHSASRIRASLLIQPAGSVHQSAYSASRISAPVCSFSQQDQCQSAHSASRISASLLIQPAGSVPDCSFSQQDQCTTLLIQPAGSVPFLHRPVCSFSQQDQCQSAHSASRISAPVCSF